MTTKLYPTPIPELRVTVTPWKPPVHELKGWEELDQWGKMNHPHWRDIQRVLGGEQKMSEIDKLRLLAGEMLRLVVEMQEREFANPAPMMLVVDNDFAYSSIEEFEKLVGYEVGDTFRDGWRMARTTNTHLGITLGTKDT